MKWKRVALWVSIALTAALAAALAWPQGGSRGVLYRVQKGKGTAYLLGSIHVGNNRMYPFGDEIRNAMAASDTFVYECDTDSVEALQETMRRMSQPQEKTLRETIGETLYAQLGEVCTRLNIPLATMDAQPLWVVINTLAVHTTAVEMGVADVTQAMALGVEQQVKAYATEHDKPVAFLETLGEQLDTLEGFSLPLQSYLLQSECEVILQPATARGMDATIAYWPEWWRRGMLSAFADSYLKGYLEPGYEAECMEYHTKLITERNQRMAERLLAMLAQGDTRFVTVGLLHLVLPEDSVVALMKAQGCTVTLLSAP